MSIMIFDIVLLFIPIVNLGGGDQVFIQTFPEMYPSGENSVGSVLFERGVLSSVHCATLCKWTPLCKFVAVSSVESNSSSSLMCRGHADVTSDSSTSVTDPSASVWILRDSAWLEKKCSSNSECGEPLRECFAGSCLCHPGYYYSLSQDDCVHNCSKEQQQSRFLAYPEHKIFRNNIAKYPNITLSACLDICALEPEARTCDYTMQGSTGICRLQDMTPLDVSADLWAGSASHTTYQKSCV